MLLDALPQFRERGLELRVIGLQTPQGGNQGLDLLVFLQRLDDQVHFLVLVCLLRWLLLNGDSSELRAHGGVEQLLLQ